jgi:hypothetical protein
MSPLGLFQSWVIIAKRFDILPLLKYLGASEAELKAREILLGKDPEPIFEEDLIITRKVLHVPSHQVCKTKRDKHMTKVPAKGEAQDISASKKRSLYGKQRG